MLPWFHFLLIYSPVLYILSGQTKHYDFFLALIITISFHWAFTKNECVCSYLYKIQKDPDYILGTDAEATDIVKTNYFLSRLSIFTTIAAGLYLTARLGYNIPVFLLIMFIPIVVHFTKFFKHFVVPILCIYFLKDNQHLMTSLLFTIGVSMMIQVRENNKKDVL